MERDEMSEKLDDLYFRQWRLRRKADQVAKLVSTLTNEVAVRCRDEKGLWSEWQGRRLIDELVKSLEASLRAQGDPELSPEGRELFETFLYCALRLMENPPDGDEQWVHNNWSALIRTAADLAYQDPYELYYKERYGGMYDSSFIQFSSMYHTLTGHYVEVPQTELDIMEARFAQRREQEEKEAEARLEAMRAKGFDIEGALKEWDEEFAAHKQMKKVWAASFRDSDTFCRAYLRFRELYFSEKGWLVLGPWVKQAVYGYLSQQNKGLFLTDDVFFSLYGLLDRVEKKLRATLDRED